MPVPRIMAKQSAILVIDIQEKLLPHIHNAGAIVPQIGRLIDGAKALGVPVIATEQYRKGLGVTVPEIASRLVGVQVFEKLKFSACVEPVREVLAKQGTRCVVVCGIEAHVCVLQTCLDLIDQGYVVALAVDAIGSRRAGDQEAAVSRLTQAGVLPTTVEAALLEMVHEAGGPGFKAVLPIIK